MFSIGGLTFYGGGGAKSASVLGMDYVIDLADAFKSPNKWTIPDTWKTVELKYPTRLDWYITDGAAPNLPLSFWKSVILELENERKRRSLTSYNILVACQGGHGRTGTVLTALAFAAGVIPEQEDAVKWIRSHYCKESVEKLNQIEYLKALGAYTNETGSYSKTYPTPTPSTPWYKSDKPASGEVSKTEVIPVKKKEFGDKCACGRTEAESLDCEVESCDFTPSEKFWAALEKELLSRGLTYKEAIGLEADDWALILKSAELA